MSERDCGRIESSVGLCVCVGGGRSLYDNQIRCIQLGAFDNLRQLATLYALSHQLSFYAADRRDAPKQQLKSVQQKN